MQKPEQLVPLVGLDQTPDQMANVQIAWTVVEIVEASSWIIGQKAPMPYVAVPVGDIVDLRAVAGAIGVDLIDDRTVSDRMVDLEVLVGDGVITGAIVVRNGGQWHHDEHCQRE